MKITTKINFFLFIGFLISITYQYEDFGLFKAFTTDKKHDKTEDSNKTDSFISSNSTNSTNTSSVITNSEEESSKNN